MGGPDFVRRQGATTYSNGWSKLDFRRKMNHFTDLRRAVGPAATQPRRRRADLAQCTTQIWRCRFCAGVGENQLSRRPYCFSFDTNVRSGMPMSCAARF